MIPVILSEAEGSILLFPKKTTGLGAYSIKKLF